MVTELEDLRILKTAEEIADSIWKKVVACDEFAKDVVGKQLGTSADSIEANIAESYGRFSYGEKLQFLYYSRGSLFETKYWLNRALVRDLFCAEDVRAYGGRLSDVARQLNAFAGSLKSYRNDSKAVTKSVRETEAACLVEAWVYDSTPLLTHQDLNWLSM